MKIKRPQSGFRMAPSALKEIRWRAGKRQLRLETRLDRLNQPVAPPAGIAGLGIR
jgi:hypothetical protein